MANVPVGILPLAAVTARGPEVPAASFVNGVNAATMATVGIATDNPGLSESLPSWTLLDQFGVARTPQKTQFIGGSGLGFGTQGRTTEYPIITATASASGDGAVTATGAAHLADLAAGWVSVPF
jgi:hypothetical protein